MNYNRSQVNNSQTDNSQIFRYPTHEEILAARAQSKAVKLSNEDGDLSGCLASQGFAVKKPTQPKQPVESYRDEDLSGCLTSGFLKPKQQQLSQRDRFTPTRRDSTTGEVKPIDRDARSENLQPPDEEKSGWLYFN